MAYSEKVEHKLEIIPPWCVIQCRRADIVLKDGVEIASTFHRHVLYPGNDLSNEDPRVVGIASVTWTEEVVSAYQTQLQQALSDPLGIGTT